jgi:hypothetical protein
MNPEFSFSWLQDPPLGPILNHINASRSLKFYFFMAQLLLQSRLRFGFPSGPCISSFPAKISVHISTQLAPCFSKKNIYIYMYMYMYMF